MTRYFPCLTLTLLFSLSLAAQTASAPAAASNAADKSAPVIRTRTQLVLVPVVVTGRDGKHLEKLPQAAFRIEENGKPQNIALFEEVRTESMSGKDVANEPGKFSNLGFRDARALRINIILLDRVNTPILAQHDARQQLIKYLETSVRRDEPTALFGLGRNGLRQIVSFRTEPAVLVAALRKVRGQVSQSEMDDSSAQMNDTLTSTLQNSADQSAQQIASFLTDSEASVGAYHQRLAIRQTLQALNELARAYAAIPGRKTLIWATAGFPFMINDPQSFANMGLDMVQEYEDTWHALMSANIAVYTVDVQGLVNPDFLPGGRMDIARSSAPRSAPLRSTPIRVPYNKHAEQEATLRAVSEATGGRPCVNTNDLTRCFESAVEDSRAYYMLAFYLASEDTAPGWRKLKVKVQADGAHVRAREGFYVAGPKADTPEERKRAFTAAINSPVQYNGVHFTVTPVPPAAGEPTPQPGAKLTRVFAMHLFPGSFFIDRQNNNTTDLDIAMFAIDENDRIVARSGHTLHAALKAETVDRMAQTGLDVKDKLELPRGSYRVKVLIRDNESGEIGTVQLPFEVK